MSPATRERLLTLAVYSILLLWLACFLLDLGAPAIRRFSSWPLAGAIWAGAYGIPLAFFTWLILRHALRAAVGKKPPDPASAPGQGAGVAPITRGRRS